MARYGMAVDLTRCFGCQNCTIACKMANNLPANMYFNHVETLGGGYHPETPGGVWPDCQMSYQPVTCQHCSNPACAKVCPTGATHVDADTGIVLVDDSKCIGCRSCIMACPYDGVRTLVGADAEWYTDHAVGEYDAPPHTVGTVEKCTFCVNLQSRGEEPACMQLCPGRARYFGDLDDPDSDISKAILGREYKRLHEELGTEPNCYYLV